MHSNAQQIEAIPPQASGQAHAAASPAKEQLIQTLMQQISLRDMQSILFFGAQVQQRLSELSEQMLGDLRNKDTGKAGEALNAMVATLRGFDAASLQQQAQPGWIGRLMGSGRNIAKALQRYESVRDQIDAIAVRLQQHQTELLIDIEALERLYAAGTDGLHEMENHIAAGQRRLALLQQHDIPRLQANAQANHNTLASQRLRDVRTAGEQLEKRVHDLQLSRQVLLQNLPAIRLIQENDRALVAKIQSTLVNTLPLWQQQLAQALTIERSREAAASLQAASDLTNELLRANAEGLRESNRAVRTQTERGIFDIDAIEDANRALIDTINDSLDIAEQGRQAREQANTRLQALEQQLHQSLSAASSRKQSLAGKTHVPKYQGANQDV